MRAPDSEYQPNRWREDRPERKIRRRWTRWGLAISVALSLLILAGETAFNGVGGRLTPDLFFLEAPMFVASLGSPFARDTWFTRRGLERYDEFERATLGRAGMIACGALILGITGALLLVASAMFLGDPVTFTPRLLVLWAVGVLAVGFALPALVAEWTVPFPDAEDQPL